jgi:hypothetical protein
VQKNNKNTATKNHFTPFYRKKRTYKLKNGGENDEKFRFSPPK